MGGEFALSAAEIAQIEADSTAIIEVDDTTAEIWRPQIEGEDEFDGEYVGDYDLIGVIDVDFNMQPDAEVLEPDTDAIADAKADADAQKKDKAIIRGETYIVWHVKDFGVAGVGTFKRLNLQRQY